MDKIVLCKTLEKPTDKNGKPYTKIVDQYNDVWNIFNINMNFEVGVGYLFSYIIDDKGYNKVQQVRKLENIFVQKALREVANINDIKKDLSVCLAYTKDLIVGDKIDLKDWFEKSYEVYSYIINKAQSLMPKEDTFDFGGKDDNTKT